MTDTMKIPQQIWDFWPWQASQNPKFGIAILTITIIFS